MDVNALKRKKAEALAEAEAINKKLEADNLPQAERDQLEMRADSFIALAEKHNAKLEAKLSAENIAMGRPAGERTPPNTRQTQADPPGAPIPAQWDNQLPSRTGRYDRDTVQSFASVKASASDSAGFDGLGDFLDSIKKQREGRAFDQRLGYMAAQTKGDLPAGGFLVPDLLQSNIIQTLDDDEPWLDLIDRYMLPSGYGSTSWPVFADRDESGEDVAGVSTTRRGENTTIATSTMTLEKWILEPTSHGTLIKVSNELLEDSLPGSVNGAINTLFVRALRQRMALDLLTGTGVGGPIGIVNSDATYTVAKESMQTAATITGTNLQKMRQRLKPSSLNRAVWLANPDTYIQLTNAHTTLTNDDQPLFVHGNGTDVPDTLLGRPIYFTSACESLGTKGDIVLGNLSTYQYAMKPLVVDSSTAVAFEEHQTVYKVLARDAGRPKYTSTHTDVRGFETSEFVTLATRA